MGWIGDPATPQSPIGFNSPPEKALMVPNGSFQGRRGPQGSTGPYMKVRTELLHIFGRQLRLSQASDRWGVTATMPARQDHLGASLCLLKCPQLAQSLLFVFQDWFCGWRCSPCIWRHVVALLSYSLDEGCFLNGLPLSRCWCELTFGLATAYTGFYRN